MRMIITDFFTDATVRMTKNSTNAEIWTQVGYFPDTPRIISNVILSNRYLAERSAEQGFGKMSFGIMKFR